MLRYLNTTISAGRAAQIPRIVLPSQHPRLISSTASAGNNAQEIEKLNRLVKQKLIEIQEDEKRRMIDDKKVTLSDFSRPLLLTLVIGSTACLSLHWLWWYLEYDIREQELKEKLAVKEAEFQKALEISNSKTRQKSNGTSIWSRLAFWRR